MSDIFLVVIVKDLQKIFDQKFLEIIACLGFKTPVIRYFDSGLSNRKFVYDVFSEAANLNNGVA